MSSDNEGEERNKIELNDSDCGGWVELEDRKDRCRVLLPNPVCFLSVVDNKASPKARKDAQEGTVASPRHNVMVLSWLTSIAGTENGRFAFSLNRRRHTASILDNDTEFCLSIPVQGMEELVCNVGSTSGRWGSSKFPAQHARKTEESAVSEQPKSKRARRKELFSCGVPGLYAVPLGQEIKPQNDIDSSGVFAIEGTVAHLSCKIVRKEEEILKDDKHFFVLADIMRAFVLQSYWDATRNTFVPKDGAKPTLSFFGSQTFGYVKPKAPMMESQTKLYENSEWFRLTERKQFSRLLYTNALCLIYGTDPVRGGKAGKVLSCLTATNNEGAFMFSIDRNWIDENSIQANSMFTLYIPTLALEDVVKALEKRSGTEDHNATYPKFRSVVANSIQSSNDLEKSTESTQIDIMEGTVAKLSCVVQSITDEHALVVFARVESAIVHKCYWDEKKNLFRPQIGCPTYMKYLGNQTYGYVVAE